MSDAPPPLAPRARARLIALGVATLIAMAVPLYLGLQAASLAGYPPIPMGQYVVFPLEARPVGNQGFHVLDPRTNLPSGTRLRVHLFSTDLDQSFDTTVVAQRISVRVPNYQCHWFGGRFQGSSLRVTATTIAHQPDSVRKALGEQFERMTGRQVRLGEAGRYLQAEAYYQLPAATCVSWVQYVGTTGLQAPMSQRPLPAQPGHPSDGFPWCPDVAGTLPLEAGRWQNAERIALQFNHALAMRDDTLLRALADPSVATFDTWRPLAARTPQVVRTLPAVHANDRPVPCGKDVSLRTLMVELNNSPNPDGIFYLVLRHGGWRVWMQKLCTTRAQPCMS